MNRAFSFTKSKNISELNHLELISFGDKWLIIIYYMAEIVLLIAVELKAEKTHRWGKDHSGMAGLQFNKTGTDQWRKYYFICI